jgi:hypothetical protein
MFRIPRNIKGLGKADRAAVEEVIQQTVTNPHRYGRAKRGIEALVEELNKLEAKEVIARHELRMRVYDYLGRTYGIVESPRRVQNTVVGLLERLGESDQYLYAGGLAHTSQNYIQFMAVKLGSMAQLLEKYRLIGRELLSNGDDELQVGFSIRTTSVFGAFIGPATYEIRGKNSAGRWLSVNLDTGRKMVVSRVQAFNIHGIRQTYSYNLEGELVRHQRHGRDCQELEINYHRGKQTNLSRYGIDKNGLVSQRQRTKYTVRNAGGNMAVQQIVGVDNAGNNAVYWVDRASVKKFVASLGSDWTDFDEA